MSAGQSASASNNNLPTRRVRLPPRSEFRFELESNERIAFRLVGGDAEVFGAPLVGGEGKWYPFGEEAKAAIASWNGAELEMSVSCPTQPTPSSLRERGRVEGRGRARSWSRFKVELPLCPLLCNRCPLHTWSVSKWLIASSSLVQLHADDGRRAQVTEAWRCWQAADSSRRAEAAHDLLDLDHLAHSTFDLQPRSPSQCEPKLNADIFILPHSLSPMPLILLRALHIAGQATFESTSDEPSPTFTTHTKLHLALERSRIQARHVLRSNPALVQSIANAPAVTSAEHQRTHPPLSYDVGNEQQQQQQSSLFASLSADEATAYRAEGQGPRVMVVGGESSGKSSLVKFLANYAMRSPAVCSLGPSASAGSESKNGESQPEITGWWPVIVNLNPGDGAAPLPFTFSALPLSPLPTAFLASTSPALPYGLTTSTTGAIHPSPTSAHIVSPYTLWLGRNNVRENEMHAKRVVDWLAEGLERRLARDARARMSGVLVDTAGVITADGRSRYAWIQYCARAFKVDTIVVLGHDKLNIELTRLYGHPSSGVTVIKLPKSGGIVELDDVYRSRLRALQVRSYFYGGSGPAKITIPDLSDPEGTSTKEVTLPGHDESLGGVSTLSAFSSTLPLDLMWVWKVGQEAMAPSSALPIGAQRTVTQTQLVKLDPATSSADQATLLHSIVALIQTPPGTGPKVGAAKAKAEAAAAAAALTGADASAGDGGLGDDKGEKLTDDEILGSPVLGFIHVADMDLNRKTITVLAPMKGKLPSLTGLVGGLEWTDS